MIQILYEDKDIVACVKPVGISSEDELPGLLMEQTNSKIYTLNRLDVPVGGVMVYAKNKQAAAKYSHIIARGDDFEKTYLAVCEGAFEQKSGVMEDILFKDSRKNKSFVVKRERKGTKKAVLQYEVKDEKQYNGKVFSLVQITLQTGRSHQIRVQFASRRHPLLGDGKYGSKVNCDIALFSHCIRVNDFVFQKDKPDGFPWNLF